MAKKKSSKKKSSKKQKSSKKAKKSKKKSSFMKTVKNHMTTSVGLPVGVIIIILVLVLVKVPYEATETYVETEEYPVEIQAMVEDTDNPVEQRVCREMPAVMRIEEDPFSPYMRPFGLNEYRCYAEVRVHNDGNDAGEWTLKYVFDISGKTVETDPLTKEVPKLSSVWFNFESDECMEGDTIEGFYEVIESPTTEECEYVSVYPNITVKRTEMRQRQVNTQRTITKYEPLWEYLLGYNKHEKV